MRMFWDKQQFFCAIVGGIFMFGGSAVAYDRAVIECNGVSTCVRTVPGHVLGLEGFNIHLSSDDRHIKWIDWKPHAFRDDGSTEYLMDVGDENAGTDIPRDFHAVELQSSTSLYDLTGIARREQAFTSPCAGECRLLVNVAADETFVLTGFRFEYLEDDARDHHVRYIGITPGRDSEGAFVTAAISDDNGSRPIAVTVDYLAVQSDYLDGPYVADSGQRGVANVFDVGREPGQAVIRGFSVNYPTREEDHHFKRLMIDLSDNRVRAAFHDNDENRVFEHFVRYSILRETPREDRVHVILGPVADAAPAPGATVSSRVCFDAVQDNIAWDYAGSRRWSVANISRLCAGNEASTEPAQCFDRAMHGGIEHGAGTQWRWQDAIELCAGSVNHMMSVGCFEIRQRRGDTQAEAINACKRR